MNITESRIEKALMYLAETDEAHATAKAFMDWQEDNLKSIRAMGFLDAEGTVAEREAKALRDADYLEAIEKKKDAVADFHILNNKRAHEMLVIDVWRTLEASRRKG